MVGEERREDKVVCWVPRPVASIARTSYLPPPTACACMELFERIFHIRQRRSTVSTELRGAVATFLTMAYILAINPIILSGAGIPPHAAAACTALAAGVCSIIMGLWANFPIALA